LIESPATQLNFIGLSQEKLVEKNVVHTLPSIALFALFASSLHYPSHHSTRVQSDRFFGALHRKTSMRLSETSFVQFLRIVYSHVSLARLCFRVFWLSGRWV
jgi:hypothetical protein